MNDRDASHMERDILREILEFETTLRQQVEAERARCAAAIEEVRHALEAERTALVARLQRERDEALARAVDEAGARAEAEMLAAQQQAERLLAISDAQLEPVLLACLSRLIPQGER